MTAMPAELWQPIVSRLSREWQTEEAVTQGLTLRNLRIFAATQNGLAERRKRLFRRGYWMRLAQVTQSFTWEKERG